MIFKTSLTRAMKTVLGGGLLASRVWSKGYYHSLSQQPQLMYWLGGGMNSHTGYLGCKCSPLPQYWTRPIKSCCHLLYRIFISLPLTMYLSWKEVLGRNHSVRCNSLQKMMSNVPLMSWIHCVHFIQLRQCSLDCTICNITLIWIVKIFFRVGLLLFQWADNLTISVDRHFSLEINKSHMDSGSYQQLDTWTFGNNGQTFQRPIKTQVWML